MNLKLLTDKQLLDKQEQLIHEFQELKFTDNERLEEGIKLDQELKLIETELMRRYPV